MNFLPLFHKDRVMLLEDTAAEFETHSSPRELDDLQATQAWRDIVTAIEARVIDLRDQLEFPHPEILAGEAFEAPDSNHVRGQLYAYRAILGLPEALKQEILQRRQETKETL